MITSRGSASAFFEGSSDQAVPFLRDQGPKLVTLFMIEDQKFQGTNMGSAMKTYFVMTLEKTSFLVYLILPDDHCCIVIRYRLKVDLYASKWYTEGYKRKYRSLVATITVINPWDTTHLQSP